MTNIGYTVNPEQDAEGFKGGFEVIPPGWHTVVITESAVKDTRDKNGKYLELKYELQDGTQRSVTDRLNIVNSSEVAQRIGRGALGKIALACGVKGTLTDSGVLHGRPFMANITVEEFESNTEKGKMLKSNKITDYKPSAGKGPLQAGDKKPPVGW